MAASAWRRFTAGSGGVTSRAGCRLGEANNSRRTVKAARGTFTTTGQIVFRRIGATEAGRYPSIASSAAGALVAFAQPRDGRSVIVVRRIAR